jgi:hypothetical protein
MEYLEGGSLAELIKEFGPLDEPTIAYVLKELLSVSHSVVNIVWESRDWRRGLVWR